ncbi:MULTISPECIES: Fe-S cluster assembly sulfur transfer protein SufU [unclassified Cryobacterium]|uniref:Fe-S cluster assembly sulfur transfer protein SufU n=1 Tax=unclassified Cryobacterium TaxID=2649013 RepID=UPI00106D0610|nr:MULTISPECIES: SUF system NifU family Fe-S cluster assembly protein [unclassified Cryobacterium]TFC53517.1 SUF system NifU family Fe-S cluster assembly protein [Cryobacterium sp. TMB3-1-2]TFC69183.1 SUF system NifU family Fe-S cluster assembly protein [Cryobacterium sp. TMB3-15]TFC76019.1 SUF system NifU family Fe-S cluster assembly protein [Cryobacterium sp. TMB3-10]TFD38173.1 SUF system NifU family Fe-S cluster assembly protein [Cryobacterium sp. TMB3-12]
MTSSAMQQLYQQIILDHAKSAHGAVSELSELDEDAAAVAAAAGLRQAQSHQVNTTCGDEITVRVALSGAGADARIDGFAWRGVGCSISMASASVLNDTVRGASVAESLVMLDLFREMLRSRGTIEPDEEVLGDAAAFAGVSKYPARVKCAMLPWVAFEAALLQLG